ncbi:MAG: M48 family metallopeptidase [Bacteroidales bacterium]|nr:M48 family metallopeptidase [Bacteroidales bacterium]
MIDETVKIIEDDEIGRVSFIRKPSVRNLKITLRPFKGVQVTVPYFVSFDRASRFVEEKRSWIRQSQRRLSQYEKRITLFSEETDFKTHDYVLKLLRHDKATIRTVIGGGCITILFPDYAAVDDPRIQRAIRKAVQQAWRIEAKKYLPGMLHELAARHGLTYGKVTVRDNKTRWGSCSRDNNISLNIHLMRLPAHLCEYVILHELSHILHKHHQQSFWQYLNRLTHGRARELDKELNAYSPEVW